MLICSLPYHGPLFMAKRTPMSRIQLERRLEMLEPEDKALLARIERVLQWDQIETGLADSDLIARADALMAELREPGLREAVQSRMELRTAVGALRRRQMGQEPPDDPDSLGYGRWVKHIRMHWREPSFGLARTFKWLPQAEAYIAEGEALDLEKLLLQEVWSHLGRLSDRHAFDFTAVVIYVLRWNVIDRWTRYHAADAGARFDDLVAEALGGHANLFAAEDHG
jgi:hypothetical protein